jgi:hypothetical protein
MSRAYRIRISESLRRHIKVGDGIQSKLEILDILPQDQTAALLERELAAAGFEQRDDGQWVRVDEDGVEVRVDAQTATVTVSAQAETELDIERERVITAAAENDASIRERGHKALAQELEDEAEAERKDLQASVTEALEAKLGDLRREFDQLSNRVTATALKQKAASMGEIQSISEDPESGSLTIRVKI